MTELELRCRAGNLDGDARKVLHDYLEERATLSAMPPLLTDWPLCLSRDAPWDMPPSGFRGFRPFRRFVLWNNWSVSTQGGSSSYSTPRRDVDLLEFTDWEVGVFTPAGDWFCVSEAAPHLASAAFWSKAIDTSVGAFVPVAAVRELLEFVHTLPYGTPTPEV